MDISQITPDLYVGAQPLPADVPALCALDIGLVIAMRSVRPHPAFSQPPLTLLWLRTYDTFFTPIGMPAFETGVRAALPVMAQGRKVLVHCHYGRHRSVAMAAAILIAQGVTAAAARQTLRAQRVAADPNLWYIRRQIERFERHWCALSREANDQPVP
ncbi:MAG: dual specificity protein phosphatase family protein [Anaerolineales bacterium]|nr:dual specificity protein phosphatase family protein [Anaerolineales bacterium]